MNIYEHFSPQEREVLRKRAERLARPIEDHEVEDAFSALIVSIGSESYAIPTDLIAGVYEDAVFVPVPCVPSFIAGITNIRGHILTVLDLASFLNVANESVAAKTLVVIAHDDLRVAFAVAEAGGTRTVSAASFAPIPDSTKLAQKGHLRGLLVDGTALLDVETILNESTERINAESH